MINELIKLATHLDNRGLHREADYLDAVIKMAGPETDSRLSDTSGAAIQEMKENAAAKILETRGHPMSEREKTWFQSMMEALFAAPPESSGRMIHDMSTGGR